MVTELVIFVLVGMVIGTVAVVGFMAGRDAAERAASATIATLRHTVVTERAAKESLQETNYRLQRLVAKGYPKDPQAPEWMVR